MAAALEAADDEEAEALIVFCSFASEGHNWDLAKSILTADQINLHLL
jgi:hypothetical protein